MAETLLDVRHEPKPQAYDQVRAAFDQVVGDSDDPVTAMATVSALLHHGFGFLWTGFYRVVAPNLLHVGPYQGTLGCLEIAFGKGVCGTAAAEQRTVIVPDVELFPGHITCDARARSEIVVPVFGAAGELIGRARHRLRAREHIRSRRSGRAGAARVVVRRATAANGSGCFLGPVAGRTAAVRCARRLRKQCLRCCIATRLRVIRRGQLQRRCERALGLRVAAAPSRHPFDSCWRAVKLAHSFPAHQARSKVPA